MGDVSENESSDSSDEFLVSPDKINLNSSFFKTNTAKPNRKSFKSDSINESKNNDDDDNGDDDDENDDSDESGDNDFHNISCGQSAEMFSQILKNLEHSEQTLENHETSMDYESTSYADKNKEKTAQVKSRNSVLSREISELLFQGETKTSLSNTDDDDDDDDGDLTDKKDETLNEYTIPEEGIKITLPGAGFMLAKRKKGGGKTIDAFIRNLMNKLKARQILIHKVGLLCWLSYGFYLNKLVNEPIIMSTAQSLVPQNSYPKNRVDLPYIEKFTKWFKKLFTIESHTSQVKVTTDSLLERLKDKKVLDYKELILLYIAMLRAIGLNCRLVISLYPPDLKIRRDLFVKSEKEDDDDKAGNSKKQKSKARDTKNKNNSKDKDKNKDKKKANSKEKEKSKDDKSAPKVIPKNSPEAEKNAKLEARKKAAEVLQKKLSQKNTDKSKSSKHFNSKGNSKETNIETEKQDKKLVTEEKSENLTISRKLRSRVIPNTESKASTSKECLSNKNTLPLKGLKRSKKDTNVSDDYMSNSDSNDSEEEFRPKRLIKTKMSKRSKTNNNTQEKDKETLSSDEEESSTKKDPENLWAEVYVESERSWICISVTREKVNCVKEVYRKARSPVLYVVAWNSEGSVKDVTRRYCPQWLTVTRKQRVDEKWWDESLTPWKEKETPISKAEDDMLLQSELERPLPKTIGECKGHPLYVLARHLLKYEALYPPDCVPLGHLPTGEAIYSRYCVYTLCSRETWLKKARVVKPNQEAYKVVKGLPRYDKLSRMRLEDKQLELFGEWQTTDYVPPEAKDGIVPRNEYGNVDLFKQCMLPKGTVHIDLPGLNRIARKLNIDCAPAVVGFKFGAMGAAPAFEGFIVCEEYEDTLREAWEVEQVQAAKREKEKRDKRVYGNWKKLIRGLLVREKLAAKYEFEREEKASVSTKRTKQRNTNEKKIKSS